MSDPKPLLFALYEQASVGCGGAPSLWTHPADERLAINSLGYWSNLARIADQAHLDMLFFGDVLGFYDVFGGSADAAMKWAVEAPANDPFMIIPALAAVTENLAFGVTVTTSYELPFTHARRFSTLDHLTNGRVGWNIVTSYLSSAARNFGLEQMIATSALKSSSMWSTNSGKAVGPATPWSRTRLASSTRGVIVCGQSTTWVSITGWPGRT